MASLWGCVMSKPPGYAMGDWLAACSMCGRERLASTLVKNWQGMWRCREHNEPRQPQDFVRGIPDIQTVPWAQPQNDLQLYVCQLNDRNAIPGWMLPGCALPGWSYIDPNAPFPQYISFLCTLTGSSAIPGYAVPGCSVPGSTP